MLWTIGGGSTKMLFCVCWAALAIVGGAPAHAQAATPVTLVRDGEAQAVIVLADRPTRSAQLAAAELAAHVELISGATLATYREGEWDADDGRLPIYVGESGATRMMGLTSHRMATQESLVRVADDHMVLIGRDDRDFGEIDYEGTGTWPGFNAQRPYYRLGTLHAVYDLLERDLGVRWYMVTELGTVAPSERTLRLETGQRRVRPWTRYRMPSKTRWEKPGRVTDTREREALTLAAQRDNNLFMLRSRLGGEPFNANHSISDWHVRFGDEHPEWFVGGQPGPAVQLRFDHPGVIEQLAADAEAFFSAPFSERRFGLSDPQAARVSAGDYFSVQPKDNRDWGSDTEPPLAPHRHEDGRAGAGVASDYLFHAVNRVAERVGEVYPDRFISTLAYADTFLPPTFDLHPNVAVQVCMMDGWDDRSLRVLRDWRPRVAQLYTWEYYIDRWESFPRVRPREIADYIGELERLGVDGFFVEMPSVQGQAGNVNPALYHLNAYVTWKMLREPGVKVDALLAEYYRLFYGPAADPMKRFWETLMEARDDPAYAEGAGSRRERDWLIAASDERIGQMREAIAAARDRVGDGVHARRIDVIEQAALGAIEQRREEYRAIFKQPLAEIAVPRFDSAPRLDGRLEDPVWEQAARSEDFVTTNGDPIPDTRTYAKVGRDETHLYVGVWSEEPLMQEQRLDQRESSPGVCTDDSIEIFLYPGEDVPERDYLQLMVNAEGLTWHHWWSRWDMHDRPEWASLGLEAAAHRGADHWSAVVAIPLKVLSDDEVTAGERWRFNVHRNRWPTMELFDPRRWQCWSPTFSRGYHRSDRFGVLRFAE